MRLSSLGSTGIGLLFLIASARSETNFSVVPPPPSAANDTEQAPVLPKPLSFEDLEPCTKTSQEMSKGSKRVVLDNGTIVEPEEVQPCVMYDTINPDNNVSTVGDEEEATATNRTSILKVVLAISSGSQTQMDGALVAAQRINEDNNGRGTKIGYYGDHFLKVRLVVTVFGNPRQLSKEDYAKFHDEVLEGMIVSIQPHYILSFDSFQGLVKPIAAKHKTMVLCIAASEEYYSIDSNDYVFGTNIPSEGRGIPALQALRFSLPTLEQRANQKIRIIVSDRTTFSRTTCQAVHDKAISYGFNSSKLIHYSPNGDDDNNGIENRNDEEYLKNLADQACSAEESGDKVAIWGCQGSDFSTTIILDRLKENGCRPSLIWFSNAGWGYAKEKVPYMHAGGPTHPSMVYSDEFFSSPQAMNDYAEEKLGYSSGSLPAYHAMYMAYQNTKLFVRNKDTPNVEEAYKTQYEEIRRHMLGIIVSETLYGPTTFNKNRRNVGRGSIGMQWTIPVGSETGEFELEVISPADQATAAAIVPAPVAEDCPPGNFVNRTRLLMDDAILTAKCDGCPVDTFHPEENSDWECRPCPDGSSTMGSTGAKDCIRLEDNLIPNSLLIFGYLVMAVNLIMSCTFASWTVYFRKDPVVQVGQKEFLLLICFGSLISTSSIIPLSYQAGSLEDTSSASRACMAWPWLYSTGWILQYSGLFAKSYRMYHVMQSAESMRRVQVTLSSTLKFVLGALLVNWAVMVPWTIVDPFSWTRTDLGIEIEEGSGVIIRESVGMCDSEHLGAWAGSLLGFHFLIMVLTNTFLWKLRSVSDRYQESKYVTLASLFACEFLLLGVPILLAVGESAEARHIALCSIIAFSDMGILLFIFVPKVKYQREGLPEGTSIVKSILKRTSKASSQQGTHSFSYQSQSAGNSKKYSHTQECTTTDRNSGTNFSGLGNVGTGVEDKA